ncbi:MAG: UDP-N-acetylmuramoyl-L-alanine--D-glutamate ligase [Clostridiales bacterium]|nr:UDP-N-acetylmuramoyl-L-alanine--D-glutamate ligase [Clostridiales bacterium]
MKNKSILVIGLGKSGMAMLKVLSELGNIVDVYDGKNSDEIEKIEIIEQYARNAYFNRFPVTYDYDFIAVSPGISLDIEIIETVKNKGIKILGEIELAYLLANGVFIGITGTNGKTTTTTLVYEIFKSYFKNVELVGNIGVPAIEKTAISKEFTYFITELSSFQLETIDTFKVKIGAILNITPDHLNRHKTMQNYIETKFRIYENQDSEGYRVLNYDDEILRNFDSENPKNFYFSRKKKLKNGAFIENDSIFISMQDQITKIMDLEEIFIPGLHNVENVLAAVSMAFLSGIPVTHIRRSVMDFKGVEHRLEIFKKKFGRVFINDSKATNPDATIKAIESMNQPTVLIAGGMDKGSDFNQMIQTFSKNIKYMVLYGETKYIIADTSMKNGFSRIKIVENLEEAVAEAINVSEDGYAILLSPACASWDMYPNFEVRGSHFKEIVEKLG